MFDENEHREGGYAMIRLEALYYLQVVASAGSINKAADKLFLSKSSLSTAIKNLEADLGVSLLERTIQGVRLTEVGQRVVQKANLIFNIIDEMERDCHQVKLYEDVKMDIYVVPSFASSVFPDILMELKRRMPKVYFDVHCVPYPEIFEQVKAATNGLGIFLGYGDLNQKRDSNRIYRYNGCAYKNVCTANLCVVSSKYSKFISANVTELTDEELRKIPQIQLTTGEAGYDGLTAELHERNMRNRSDSNYVMTTDSNVVYYQAIVNDIGVGQMIDLNVSFGNADRNRLRFIPLKDRMQMELWCVFPDRGTDEQINLVVDIIRRLVAK